MAPSNQSKSNGKKAKSRKSSLTRLMVVDPPLPPVTDQHRRRVGFMTSSDVASEILPIEEIVDAKTRGTHLHTLTPDPRLEHERSPTPSSDSSASTLADHTSEFRSRTSIPPKISATSRRRSRSPAGRRPRSIQPDSDTEPDRSPSPSPSATTSESSEEESVESPRYRTSRGRSTRTSRSPGPSRRSSPGVVQRTWSTSAPTKRKSTNIAALSKFAKPKGPVMGKKVSRRSKSPANAPAPKFKRSASPNIKVEPGIKISERKTYKCRGREESVAWYEIHTMNRLENPPVYAATAEGLTEGDLLLNWTDTSKCQVWMVSDGAKSWMPLEWGWKGRGGNHRLILTDKGQPSFVAESTWKKKYKLQEHRIIS